MITKSHLPAVSVVIPTHNYAVFLGKAIQSVLDQTFQDWELIVVDDGSTDNTPEVVATFSDPRIRYLRQANGGVAVAVNAGAKASRGQYVGLLGADDILMPDALALQVQVLDSFPDVGLVFGQAYIIDPLDTVRGLKVPFPYRRPTIIPCGQALRALLRKNPIIASSVMVRRRWFPAVGGFDLSLQWSSGEDWAFFVKVAAYASLAYVPRPLVKYRVHPNSLTARAPITEEAVAVRQRFLQKFFSRPGILKDYGHLKGMSYAYLWYRFATIAATRRFPGQAIGYFGRAARFQPWLLASGDGLFFAYCLGKALLPASLVKMGRDLREKVLGRFSLHHGVFWGGYTATEARARPDQSPRPRSSRKATAREHLPLQGPQQGE